MRGQNSARQDRKKYIFSVIMNKCGGENMVQRREKQDDQTFAKCYQLYGRAYAGRY